MRSLTWGCGQEEDPAGSSGGGGSSGGSARGGGSAAPQGPRGRSGPGGGSASRSRRKERARGGEPGRRIQQSLFTEGGGSGETRQSVCLARSGIRGQAGGGSRGSLRVLRRDPAGTRVGGGERGSRGGGVSPGNRSSASGRVGRSAGVLRGRGGTQRRSPSLPLALASSARRAGGAGLSAAGPVPRSSAPPPLPPVPPWGAEEPLPPLPPPRPFCR